MSGPIMSISRQIAECGVTGECRVSIENNAVARSSSRLHIEHESCIPCSYLANRVSRCSDEISMQFSQYLENAPMSLFSLLKDTHYASVHNYSTYPMLLHKCSKNVVFSNKICSKYVVNWGKKSQICSIHSFIHHKFYMPKKCLNKH